MYAAIHLEGMSSLVTRNTNGAINVWVYNDEMECIREYEDESPHSNCHKSLSISPNGKYMMSVHLEYALMWDLVNDKYLGKLDPCNYVAMSNNYIALSGYCQISIYNYNREKIATLGGHNRMIRSIKFSSDGSKLVSCCNERVNIWDITSYYPYPVIARENPSVRLLENANGFDVAWCGRHIIAMLGAAEKGVWDSITGSLVTSLGIGLIYAAASSTDNARIAIAEYGHIKTYLSSNWEQEYVLECFVTSCITADLSFSSDGKLLASIYGDNSYLEHEKWFM